MGNFDMVRRNLVLCVDDEPTLLRTFPIGLSRAGFRVAVADNGAAGLEAFARLKDEVCLVLADIIMPVMNGIEMAERILRLDPATKILLMSAYGDEVTGRRVRKRFPFIRKPFNYSALIERIRSIVTVQEEVLAK
jgi:DNA-binding response OmpR family regulator